MTLADFLDMCLFAALFIERDLLVFFCVSRLKTCSKIESKSGAFLVSLAWLAFRLFVSIIWKESYSESRSLRNQAVYIQSGNSLAPIFFESSRVLLDIVCKPCDFCKI